MIPLSEYPRPQFRRDSYICLNGIWKYAIRKNAYFPSEFDGDILVPFSPETELSLVNKKVMPDDYLFYKRSIEFPECFIKDKVILHFGAVDQICEVFVNGNLVGKHIGGFLPFSFDIKPFLNDGHNELTLKVQDFTNESYHSTGKQHLQPGGIFYPQQSGIYMPVWMESVSNGYIENIKYTPDIDKGIIDIEFSSSINEAIIIISGKEYRIFTNVHNQIQLENVELWSPENPYLYKTRITNGVDNVESYFAMRKISLIKEKGVKRTSLNNKPYFIKGVLDQGYYKNGLLTPENDEDYIKDIKLTKDLGFNTSRKHIKIESLRWYYHCDRLGLLVWQDFVNGCTKYDFWLNQVPLFVPYKISDKRHKAFFRENLEGRKEAYKEFLETMDLLYNSPCIMLWTIFNEGWGQFDAKSIYEILKKKDPTRLFDHASGWHDQGSGDFKSKHIYKWKVKMLPKFRLKNRAYIVSECGAFILDKNIDTKKKAGFIYSVFNNKDDFQLKYKEFIEKEISPAAKKGMSAFIYTQFSDVEEEMNGFISYDRKIVKVDESIIKEINDNI